MIKNPFGEVTGATKGKVLWNSGRQGTFKHDPNSERQQRKAVIKAVGIRQAKRLYRAEVANA
jgi:hypothetical protein